MKICPNCGKQFKKSTKYCCAACYFSVPKSAEERARMSAQRRGVPKPEGFGSKVSRAVKGKPKPWCVGELNPNYMGKAHNRPGVRDKMLEGVKKRGQAWGEEQRRRHSELMRGPTNKMRGRKHTEDTRRRISETKKEQYKYGGVRLRRYRVSSAEVHVQEILKRSGLDVHPQYHIEGVSYLYDIFVSSLNLLLEFQGDYWHANPRKYPAGTLLPMQNRGVVPVEEIWARDEAKKKVAEERGFRVAYLWESDYKRMSESEIVSFVQSFGGEGSV
jgi:hypothetical protein